MNPGPGAVGSGQSFIPDRATISSIEVSVFTANPGRGGDTITLKVLTSDFAVLATVSQPVSEGFDGWLRFAVSDVGMSVTPGSTLVISLNDTGKTVFGWRYGGNTYPNGSAFRLGSVHAENDFFFRVN